MRLEKETDLALARIERAGLLASLEHRPRALANSRWVGIARGWLTDRHWKCIQAPATFYRAVGADDLKTDGPAVRQAAACRAQKLFMTGDYVSLDEWLNRSAASIADLPDGSSTLDGIVKGLEDLFDYGGLEVAELLGRADWRRSLPKSIYPELAESSIFESWAWTARGHGTANAVSPVAWRLFAHRTEMAAMSLRETAQRAASNPVWYEVSLDVGLDEAKTVDELRSIFNRGMAEESHYWPLYTRMLRILMPRWLGSHDDVASFIKEASADQRGMTDLQKYTRLYWSYSWLESDDVDLFDGTLAHWSTMKAGFLELLRRYPQSDFILNTYAKFACAAHDSLSYREVRPQLQGRISPVAWSDRISLQSCDQQYPDDSTAQGVHTSTLTGLSLR